MIKVVKGMISEVTQYNAVRIQEILNMREIKEADKLVMIGLEADELATYARSLTRCKIQG